jgi:hypothetical protein
MNVLMYVYISERTQGAGHLSHTGMYATRHKVLVQYTLCAPLSSSQQSPTNAFTIRVKTKYNNKNKQQPSIRLDLSQFHFQWHIECVLHIINISFCQQLTYKHA